MNSSDTDRMAAPAQSLPAPLALSGMAHPAVFFDFDGTLVEIAPHPDRIVVAPGLPEMLAALGEKLEGRIALISGRPLAELDRFLGPLGIAMAGSHGGEVRDPGSGEARLATDPLPRAVVEGLKEIASRHGGLLVETKPSSAAIHYRNRPAAEDDVVASARAISQERGLAVKHGKMVVELVMPGANKGTAVENFMKMPGFTGARPIFVGDDTTDEDAFRAVLKLGGEGILVGPQRETAALSRLEGVADVHAWLEQGLEQTPS